MRDFEFILPGFEVQKQISSVLKSLDDRITLLRETNTTLEAIAQTLFKSWFVDFDPVRAKAEGRQPEGMDAATAALFPDGFEESELGEVPRGWIIKRVAEIATVTKGKSYSSTDLVTHSEIALVTLKSFERGGGFRLDGFKGYSGKYKEEQVVTEGDIIIAYTDVTQAAELIGRPAVVISVQEYKKLVASLDVGIVRPITGSTTRSFLYGLLSTEAFHSLALSHTSGTTVLHLAKDAVIKFNFPCPTWEIIEAYSTIVDGLRLSIQNNIINPAIQ